uniref:Uncharacterized protein n=1 Tax=viral metagenome TaxID=1070528 RepID=A0A6C0AYZ4_9ZZZZ
MHNFKEMAREFIMEKEKIAFEELCKLDETINPCIIDLFKILVLYKNQFSQQLNVIETGMEHNVTVLEKNCKEIDLLNALVDKEIKYTLQSFKKYEELVNFDFDNHLEIILDYKKENEKMVNERIVEVMESVADDYLSLKRSQKVLESKCDKIVNTLQKSVQIKTDTLENKVESLEDKINELEIKLLKKNTNYINWFCLGVLFLCFNYKF